MRQIKFRAWETISESMMSHKELIPEYTRIFRLTKQKNIILMQFTGLHDKNGKEIYEGDIIATKFYPAYVERISWRGKPDAICEVYWDLCGFGLKAQGEADSRYPGMHELNYEHTEVIGNIYEHPELLTPNQTLSLDRD
jgi:uncharacterized phage protein (TIGR01671 family)